MVKLGVSVQDCQPWVLPDDPGNILIGGTDNVNK